MNISNSNRIAKIEEQITPNDEDRITKVVIQIVETNKITGEVKNGKKYEYDVPTDQLNKRYLTNKKI